MQTRARWKFDEVTFVFFSSPTTSERQQLLAIDALITQLSVDISHGNFNLDGSVPDNEYRDIAKRLETTGLTFN